ncbi:hypothetical protein ACWEOW_23740 [Monashia sp. NPDC004114]
MALVTASGCTAPAAGLDNTGPDWIAARVRELSGRPADRACDLTTKQTVEFGVQAIMTASGSGYIFQPSSLGSLTLKYGDGHHQASARAGSRWYQSDSGIHKWRLAPPPGTGGIPGQLGAPGTDPTLIADIYRALADLTPESKPRIATVLLGDGTRGRLYDVTLGTDQIAGHSPVNASLWRAYKMYGLTSVAVSVTEPPPGEPVVIDLKLPVVDLASVRVGPKDNASSLRVDIQASCSWITRSPSRETPPHIAGGTSA